MSFGWRGIFRQGAWRDFRRFVLEERRDVGDRMAVIQAELSRIGYIYVVYAEEENADGEMEITERREGFAVPGRSSLGKLVKAYVAQGGNPLSISHFLLPNESISANGETLRHKFPGGGVVYPLKGDMTATMYEGGIMSIGNDISKRTGGRKRHKTERVVFHVEHSRRWITQEIRHKRNDLESRIIKLVDLREQLTEEIIQIFMAVGGSVPSIPSVDRSQYVAAFNVASLVHFIDLVFYDVDGDGIPDFDLPENVDGLVYYPFLISDADFEAGTEL